MSARLDDDWTSSRTTVALLMLIPAVMSIRIRSGLVLAFSNSLRRNLAVELSYQFYRGVHLPRAYEGNYRESGACAQNRIPPALMVHSM